MAGSYWEARAAILAERKLIEAVEPEAAPVKRSPKRRADVEQPPAAETPADAELNPKE